MSAERRELSSLPKPPEGYVWSPEARERRRANLDVYNSRAKGGAVPWQASPDGPRPDAAETTCLPTLTPGLDKLPRRCSFCRSAMLDKHETAGGEQRGTLSCTGCGRQLAWLAPRIRSASPPSSDTFAMPGRPTIPSGVGPRTMRAAVSVAFERLDGCGPACGLRTGHDPATHEGYGRMTGRAEVEDRPSGVVRTGVLTIDFDTSRVTVGDRVADLTVTELRILGVLAARLGKLCHQHDILEIVWGAGAVEAPIGGRAGRFHMARVHVTRMRQKLGEAAGLVETVKGKGLILRAEPPIGSEREQRPATRPRVRRFRLHHRLASGPGRAVRLVVGGQGARGARGRALTVLRDGSSPLAERERCITGSCTWPSRRATSTRAV